MSVNKNIVNFLLVAFSLGFPCAIGDICSKEYNICRSYKRSQAVCLADYRLCVATHYGPGLPVEPFDFPVVTADCLNAYEFAVSSCSADASIIFYYGGPNAMVTSIQDPPGPYPLGDTLVTLTVTNGTDSASCQGTVTVVDDELPGLREFLDCGGSGVIDRCSVPAFYTPTYTKQNGCPVTSVRISSYDCSFCEHKTISVFHNGIFFVERQFKTIDMLAKGWCNVSADSADTFAVHDTGGFGSFIAYNVEVCDQALSYCTEFTCTLCVDRPSPSCRAELRQSGTTNIRSNTNGRHFQCNPNWLPCNTYQCMNLIPPVTGCEY